MEARGKLLATFPVSVRLQHIFEFKHLCLFGDLHGRSLSEIRGYRNCGKKTLDELRELVRAIQHSHQTPDANGQADVLVHEAPPTVAGGAIFVPVKLHELNVADLPLSIRLEGVLQRKGVRRLGDRGDRPAKCRLFGTPRLAVCKHTRLGDEVAANARHQVSPPANSF